jgi:hypothetical protein
VIETLKKGVLRYRTPLEKLTSGLPKGSPSRPGSCLNANRQSDSFTSLEIATRKFQPHSGRHRHSAHIGQDVVVQYRWHPLHGQRVRRIQSERRASGELVHVELTPGAVTILPAWKLDAIYCAGLKVGAPQVSLAALRTLRELLACESRLVSADGNIVTQEAQDGSAVTTRTKDGACLQTHSADGTTPARSRSRRRTTSGHDTGGAPSRAESDGAAPARGGRRSNAGGQR